MDKKGLLEVELKALERMRRWHSADFCNQLAETRVDARIKAELEATERARIHELKQPQLRTEYDEVIECYRQLRADHEKIAAKVKKAREDQNSWSVEERRALQDEVDRIEREINAVTARRRLFDEETAARDTAVLQSELAALLSDKETRHAVATAIKALDKTSADIAATFARHSRVTASQAQVTVTLSAAIRGLRAVESLIL